MTRTVPTKEQVLAANVKPPDYHAEPPVNPPEISNEEFDRQVRNAWRRDGIEAIDLLDEVLGYLSDENDMDFQHFRREMAATRDYLGRDMED